MEINLQSKERLRINNYDKSNFIDIEASNEQLCIQTDFYSMHYQQLRLKNNHYRMFTFYNREYMNSYNFGYWEDAEIIWNNFDTHIV